MRTRHPGLGFAEETLEQLRIMERVEDDHPALLRFTLLKVAARSLARARLNMSDRLPPASCTRYMPGQRSSGTIPAGKATGRRKSRFWRVLGANFGPCSALILFGFLWGFGSPPRVRWRAGP